jgi:hypothetical protein
MGLFHVLNSKPAQNTKRAPSEKDMCRNIYVIYVQGDYGKTYLRKGGYRNRVKGIHEIPVTVISITR